MSHQERPPGPIRARQLRLRRATGQTRPGRLLKRLLGREVRIPVLREPGPAPLISFPGEASLPEEIRDDRLLANALEGRKRLLASRPREEPTRGSRMGARAAGPVRMANIVFVSHCDFTGNSALHVYALASELHRRGRSPVVAVPDNAESVEDVGRPPFPVLTYAEVVAGALRFPDGRGPDLVHAFTPRELVREVTVEIVRRHGCRYVVHLEDDDEVVLSAELGGADVEQLSELPLPVLDRIVRPRQSHPLRTGRFLEEAAGITVLIDRLRELVPAGVPAAVVRAGFDEALLEQRRPRAEVRTELGLEPEDLAIVYTGNVHSVNREEMRSLYAAVAQLRREGQPAVLVKTGWGSGVATEFPRLGAGLRDLGWVSRDTVWDVLSAADVLVQPGGPSPFNDYRFPSKLPEYLASGRPVVLPRTNVGLELRDGEEALLLERGDTAEIAAAITRLAADPELRERLGAAGRSFALRELRWSASVDELECLLDEIAAGERPPAPAWLLDGADPPVKLVLSVPGPPDPAAAAEAHAHGIFGFCLEAEAAGDLRSPAPLGLRYLRAGGMPLTLEEGAVSAKPERYDELMRERLGAPPRGGSIYPEIPFPRASADQPIYELWLRKLVLRTALLAPFVEPFVFLDADAAWPDPDERAVFLGRTLAGARDGIRQYYASRGLSVSSQEAELILRST